jgi:S1-C subfamily serine protease
LQVQQAASEGRYGGLEHPRLKTVPVAFLYSTDTTGGNSGSPVLNAKGQLVGVNFDRAFEATINDFAWNQRYSRSIGVDIRYVLWITGEVFGAKHIVEEMQID